MKLAEQGKWKLQPSHSFLYSRVFFAIVYYFPIHSLTHLYSSKLAKNLFQTCVVSDGFKLWEPEETETNDSSSKAFKKLAQWSCHSYQGTADKTTHFGLLWWMSNSSGVRWSMMIVAETVEGALFTDWKKLPYKFKTHHSHLDWIQQVFWEKAPQTNVFPVKRQRER